MRGLRARRPLGLALEAAVTQRCPRCIGGQVLTDDGRSVCLACGWSRDPEPDTLEKLLSNATPEEAPNSGTRGGRPSMPLPNDLAAIKARVMDRIRQEAAL